jgi:dienelactone hydrolase
MLSSSNSEVTKTTLQSQTWIPLRTIREIKDPLTICSPESIPRIAKDETYAKDLLHAWNQEFQDNDDDDDVLKQHEVGYSKQQQQELQKEQNPVEKKFGDLDDGNDDIGTAMNNDNNIIWSRRKIDTYGCVFPYTCKNGDELSGYIIVPSCLKECNFNMSQKVPVVILFHTGAGPQDIFNRYQGDKLAREAIWGEQGCIIFIADMLSDPVGWTWGDRDRYWQIRKKLLHVSEQNGVRVRYYLQERLHAVMDAITSIDAVDPDRIAAVGFCMGGQPVLELGRMKFDGIRALITFHGMFDGYDQSDPSSSNDDEKEISNDTRCQKAREVLICTGGLDPYVPYSSILGVQKVFQDASWNTNVLHFESAKHNFSNPRTKYDDPNTFGYDENASTTSWDATIRLLHNVFQL